MKFLRKKKSNQNFESLIKSCDFVVVHSSYSRLEYSNIHLALSNGHDLSWKIDFGIQTQNQSKLVKFAQPLCGIESLSLYSCHPRFIIFKSDLFLYSSQTQILAKSFPIFLLTIFSLHNIIEISSLII